MVGLQRNQSHTWNIFHSVCFMAESTAFASVHCSVGWIWLFCKIVFLFFHNVTFTWYPLRKIIIALVTFSPVCVPLSWPLLSFPSPFVVFVLLEQLHGSQRRVKILITLHTTRLGHKESVSRLNLMWSRRFTRNSRYLVFELRGLSFLQIGSCHSIFGNV